MRRPRAPGFPQVRRAGRPSRSTRSEKEREGESKTGDDSRYKLRVITRSETRTKMGMGVVVTVNLLVGHGETLSLAGTLSMTEEEWLPLRRVLADGLGDHVRFEEGVWGNQ